MKIIKRRRDGIKQKYNVIQTYPIHKQIQSVEYLIKLRMKDKDPNYNLLLRLLLERKAFIQKETDMQNKR